MNHILPILRYDMVVDKHMAMCVLVCYSISSEFSATCAEGKHMNMNVLSELYSDS